MENIGKCIAQAARGWIGTRFHHQGRLKRTANHAGGVDCLGLLIGVAGELGLTDGGGRALVSLDHADYGHIPCGEMLLDALYTLLEHVEAEQMGEGDVLLFALEDSPRHLAILSERDGAAHMIHAYAQARKVTEQPLDTWWRARLHAAFRIYHALPPTAA